MRKFVKALSYILPHISIVASVMYIVFYFINNVNSSMKFLDPKATPATFIIILILSFASIVCSAILIAYRRKIERLEYELQLQTKKDADKKI